MNLFSAFAMEFKVLVRITLSMSQGRMQDFMKRCVCVCVCVGGGGGGGCLPFGLRSYMAGSGTFSMNVYCETIHFEPLVVGAANTKTIHLIPPQ